MVWVRWVGRFRPSLRPRVLGALSFVWRLRWVVPARVAAAYEYLDGSLWPLGVAIGAVAAQLTVVLPNTFGVTAYSVVWILATFAGICVTLLALLFAISTVRGQQLAARLPPEIVADLFAPGWHRATIWRLAGVLVVSLLGLAPIVKDPLPNRAINAVPIDIVLLAWAIVGIMRGSTQVFERSYPVRVARQLRSYLTETYLLQRQEARRWPAALTSGVLTSRADPFALIEQVCDSALRAGDLTTAHIVLRATTRHVLDFEKEHPGIAGALFGWIGELLSVVGRKALKVEERTAEYTVRLFDRAILTSLGRYQRSERSGLLEKFRELRHAAIKSGAVPVVRLGFDVLARGFESALPTAPPEDKVASLYSGEATQPGHDSRSETQWRSVEDEWLHDINGDVELVARYGLEDVMPTVQSVIQENQRAVLVAWNLGPRQKRALLRYTFWQSAAVVQTALDRGCGEAFVVSADLLFLTHDLLEAGLNDMIVPALKPWRPVLLETARRGILPWHVLNDFAAAGRGLAREAQDEAAVFVVETLGALLASLAFHRAGKMQELYEETIKHLRSIATLDEREDSQVKQAVTAQLARRPTAKGSREDIQTRAYELYIARGRAPGHEIDDWLQAERDFQREN